MGTIDHVPGDQPTLDLAAAGSIAWAVSAFQDRQESRGEPTLT
jgi:hypothetical protein